MIKRHFCKTDVDIQTDRQIDMISKSIVFFLLCRCLCPKFERTVRQKIFELSCCNERVYELMDGQCDHD